MSRSRSTPPNPDLIRDEATTSSGLNLSALQLLVLQRLDPLIEEVLAVTSSAILFQLDSSGNEWHQMDVEGSFFIVKRNAPDRFQFIIMNRINTEHLVEDILALHEYDVKLPHLTYKNKDNVSRCIFFSQPESCQDICNVLDRITTGYRNPSPKPKLSPCKIKRFGNHYAFKLNQGDCTEPCELEKPVIDPASDFTKALPIVSAVGSELATENSSLQLFNQVTTAVTNQGTFASSTPAVGPVSIQFGQLQFELNLPQMLYQQSMPATQPIPPPSFHLARPSDFYVPPNSSCPMNFIPSTVCSVVVSSQHDTTLPAQLPPLNPSYPSTPNLSNAPSVCSKEKIREVFARLILNESFVDMVYQEMLRMHHP